jgi:AcrR family transcriptional regulator
LAKKSVAEIRKEEIVNAFFKVVSERGFAQATIREVAHAAGCNHGMLHHYFENKEAIIQAAVAHVVTAYRAELLEGLSRLDSATDRLRYLIAWFNDLCRFDLEFSRAWMEFWVLSKNDPAVSAALRECYQKVKDIFARVIRDGIKAGEFRKVNPVVTANVILGSLEGCTTLWVLDTGKTPVKDMGEQMEEIFSGFLTKREA